MTWKCLSLCCVREVSTHFLTWTDLYAFISQGVMPWFTVTMSTVPSKLKRCGAAVSTCIYPPELHWQNVGLMSDFLPPHWQEYYVGNDPTSWWRGPPIVHCESSADMGYVWCFHLTHCMVAPLYFFRLCVFVGSILQLPYMLLTKVVCDHKWFLTYKYIYKFQMYICERKSFQKNLWVPLQKFIRYTHSQNWVNDSLHQFS